MCQGNGEVTAAHPFCVVLQKDRLYFKGTDRGTDLIRENLQDQSTHKSKKL